jgi:hypothetical protein
MVQPGGEPQQTKLAALAEAAKTARTAQVARTTMPAK